MTTPSPTKVIPVDTIQAQHIETPPPPPYEPNREEGTAYTSHKNSATKSENSRKRRKKAKRKPRSVRLDCQEDEEVLLSQQLLPGDEETAELLSGDEDIAETLLPLQRSHDQSCDTPVPGSTLSRGASITNDGASLQNSSRELSLNSGHSAERGVAISETARPQDTVLLVVH